MKQYDSYKDSGVQWIGRIPSHWECASISHLTTSRSGGTPDRQKKEYWDNGTINWMSSGEVNKGMVYDTEEFITKLGSLNSSAKPLPKNSVMIALNGQGKTKGMAAVLKIKAACNQSLCAFSCDNRLHYMYLYYNFKSMYKYLRSQAGDDTRDGLAASFVKKQKIPLPPFTEQESIVNYIDKKCAEIDKAIATQQRRIELLQELRQNIITHAVTRGINPDVPLKDSGVEWIGMVPEHWGKCRFKDFVTLKTDVSLSDNKIGLENIEGKTGQYIETNSEFEGNGVAFDINDIIYGKLRPYLQKVWLATFAGNAVGDFFVFRCKRNCESKYLQYLMLSDGFTSECNGATLGAKMPRVSSDFILSLPYYLPSISEQQAIVAHIISETTKLDKLVAKANRQISLLQELKQSIITEVVTGKRKVC